MEFVPLSEAPLRNLGVLILPSVILGTALAAATMRMTRTMMLEVLRQDYIRTAWAKGLRERIVVLRHTVKNALIPVVSLIGLQVPILVGGSVIMESMFNLPGLGRLMVTALEDRDYPVVSGITAAAIAGIRAESPNPRARRGPSGPMKRSFSRLIGTGPFPRRRRTFGPSSACATTGSGTRPCSPWRGWIRTGSTRCSSG